MPRLHNSLPRTWGQCQSPKREYYLHRFTPTHVGTIEVGLIVARRNTVHPHARGDNLKLNFRVAVISGSPPRTWESGSTPSVAAGSRFTPTHVGTMLVGRAKQQAGVRFTPTHVGTIQRIMFSIRTQTVHPHARGDNWGLTKPQKRTNGSPPRTWGQCFCCASAFFIARFTPTHVGTIRYTEESRPRTRFTPTHVGTIK